MKKILLSLSLILMVFATVDAQKYFTRSGQITFSSDAPLEKIEAQNSTATSVLDVESGRMEFAVLIKAFQFEKALMQEHFNENYMESSKFPKAIFKGKIADLSKVDFSKDGTYEVLVEGKMLIHGVSNDIKTAGSLIIENGKIKGTSTFNLRVADYNIDVPSVVAKNIAEIVEVKANLDYELFKKGS